MDVIHKKANLILALRDGYTGSVNLKGVIRAVTHNGITAAGKGDGYFVFVDLKPGVYTILIEASMYGGRSFRVHIQDSVQMRYLTLQPGKSYPLLGQAVRISGRLHKNLYAALEGGETVSILGEYEPGEQNLKFFFSESEPVYGREFYIFNGEQNGIYRIVAGESEKMNYTLDRPLDFAIGPACTILPAYEICPEDRRYFFAVKGDCKKIYFLAEDKKIPLELQPDVREYNLDLMED